MNLKVKPSGRLLVVVWPFKITLVVYGGTKLVRVQSAPPSPEVFANSVALVVNGVLIVRVRFVPLAKPLVAPEHASNAPTVAAAPTPQRKMKAKAEVAAGFATKLRMMGSTCSSAARTMA